MLHEFRMSNSLNNFVTKTMIFNAVDFDNIEIIKVVEVEAFHTVIY